MPLSALAVLALAVRRVLGRLPALRGAVLAVRRRQTEVEAVALRARQVRARALALRQDLILADRRSTRPDRPGLAGGDGCARTYDGHVTTPTRTDWSSP